MFSANDERVIAMLAGRKMDQTPTLQFSWSLPPIACRAPQGVLLPSEIGVGDASYTIHSILNK